MHPVRKRRLYFILFLVLGIALAIGIAMFALRQNIDLYYTPSQVLENPVAPNQILRVGGIVEPGSFHRIDNGLQVNFVLTDHQNTVKVYYDGVLPTLFRSGQGIIVQGKFNAQHILVADQVLAKHDNKYMPPDLEKLLKKKATT